MEFYNGSGNFGDVGADARNDRHGPHPGYRPGWARHCSEWRLVLANRSVRRDGSRDLYNKVNRVLVRLRLQDTIWIGIVSIVDLRVPIVQSLRAALGTAGSVDGARLDNATIDGVRIPPCLVYRLTARQKLASHAGGPPTAGRHLA